jgi:hypothetical protein
MVLAPSELKSARTTFLFNNITCPWLAISNEAGNL